MKLLLYSLFLLGEGRQMRRSVSAEVRQGWVQGRPSVEHCEGQREGSRGFYRRHEVPPG